MSVAQLAITQQSGPVADEDVASPAAAASGTARTGINVGRLLLRVGSLLAFVLFWQFASQNRLHLGIVTFQNVPAPSEVLPALLNLLQSPKVLDHVLNSLYRVFGGFLGATGIGILLGLLIGRSRWAADLLLPPLEVLRPIPGVAWIPLAILMFPSSELSMIFITFMGALFPILLNTIHGVGGIDQRLISTARSLGAGRGRLYLEVILPAALPSVVTGLSIGMGTSWFCLVTAEMIAGQYGIGYYTWESYNLQRYADIVVGMLLIGVFGMGSSVLVRKLGDLLTPWYQIKGGKTHD
ncbi:ABC transporter permease [Dechloromonas denitrificans]|jgi:NitT/TauT family transport system permease protein|uniref:ABC transporter permease n=1 Tax=Dechloromonas denitrificans TaxID=281362 RepID=UPI0039AEAAA6|nr:ABC transporter permease [Dechloromonas denitrificans]